VIGSRPFLRTGLPSRARALLEEKGWNTLGDVVALDQTELLGRSNLGRGTLNALLQRAEELAGQAAPPLSRETTFVQIVDGLLTGMKGVARDVVQLRFLEHLTLQECGQRLTLSRERIRQVEVRVLARLADHCREIGWHGASILDDGLIEFGELQPEGTTDPAFAPGLYVTLARATLLKARALRQIEAFYHRELDVLVDDLADSPSALAGCLTDQDILRRASELTPALMEWPTERLLKRVRRVLGESRRGGRARVVALLRALVRQAGGGISLAALRYKLGALLAAGGHARVLDDATVRSLVQRSGEFCMRDASTVGRSEEESEAQRAWAERAVAFILKRGRPASLAKFLERHSECDSDEFSLAAFLNRDPRVERIGRRLYCAAGAGPDGPVRVLDILLQALDSEKRPWTHRELLEYVRHRRDLRSNQVELYLPRIPGLVRYSAHCVGLEPLSRPVVLQLFGSEQFVLDRLEAVTGSGSSGTIEDLWIDDAGDDDRLSATEAQAILDSAESWRKVRIGRRDPLLFIKEV
jgi:hypothetical protein